MGKLLLTRNKKTFGAELSRKNKFRECCLLDPSSMRSHVELEPLRLECIDVTNLEL